MTPKEDNTSSIDESLRQAITHFRHGQLAEAESLALGIIRTDSNNSTASHLLGIIALQQRNYEVAGEHLATAINGNPRNPVYHYSHGLALYQIHRLEEALAAFEHAIQCESKYAEAHCNRGMVLSDLGRSEEALQSCNRAIQINPESSTSHNIRGVVLHRQCRLEEALVACEHAIRIKQEYAEAHNNRSIILTELGHHEMALAACEQAIRINPEYSDAYSNRGAVLIRLGRPNDALAACDQAISLNPKYAEAHSNRGLVLLDLDRTDEALAACERAVQLDPQHADAQCNRGLALQKLGRLDDAMAALEQAIRVNPEHARAHNNHAMLLLLKGDYSHGWAEYEWRWKLREFTKPPGNYQAPQWDGGPLEGRTILLHAEQGFGDTLQFIRYLSGIAASGGKVALECQPELVQLLSATPGLDSVAAQGEPLPEYDCHAALMSLPLLLGTRLDSIPDHTPYLFPPRLPDHTGREIGLGNEYRNIGFVWAGSPGHKNDRNRSVSLARFDSLLDIPGLKWFSLQKGVQKPDQGPDSIYDKFVDTSPYLSDFSDTASVVGQLDLVITVDTSVAHLAGALRIPAWVLLPFVPDWRWLMHREDSPWYPNMHLFRQQHRGDWDGVFTRLEAALRELAG